MLTVAPATGVYVSSALIETRSRPKDCVFVTAGIIWVISIKHPFLKSKRLVIKNYMHIGFKCEGKCVILEIAF